MNELRNDLFEAEVTHGLIKMSTDMMLLKRPPLSKNADMAAAYNMAAAEKYDALVKEKSTHTEEEHNTEEDDENAAE